MNVRQNGTCTICDDCGYSDNLYIEELQRIFRRSQSQKRADEAKKMLKELSGNMHEVITSVALTDKAHQVIINDITKVYFKALSNAEIDYYLENYKPYDKAGSYGIQEWIGFIGIEKIEGSYFNVMGFPTHKFYQALLEF